MAEFDFKAIWKNIQEISPLSMGEHTVELNPSKILKSSVSGSYVFPVMIPSVNAYRVGDIGNKVSELFSNNIPALLTILLVLFILIAPYFWGKMIASSFKNLSQFGFFCVSMATQLFALALFIGGIKITASLF